MNSFENPTIVVLAYNRLHSITRLLMSLTNAHYNTSVRLVLSIDGAINSENKEVIEFCNEFKWDYGEKIVTVQEKNLGIIKHVFISLNLTEKYKSVILLEDDHYLSPVFYKMACEFLKFYVNEEKIFALSLYSHAKNGYNNLPFHPLQEDNDVYFIQVGFTQGILISEKQWSKFKKWYSNVENQSLNENDPLHPILLQLDVKRNEWFPKVTKYLVSENNYIAFPRNSLSVNFHDIGTHNKVPSSWYQVPIIYEKENFKFKKFIDSNSVYDSFLEILPDRLIKLNQNLATYDFDVDLYGSKPKKILTKQFLLTTRIPKKFEKSFEKRMKPLEQNVIENVEGKGIYIANQKDYKFTTLQDLKNKRSLFYYFNEGINLKILVKLSILGILQKLKLI